MTGIFWRTDLMHLPTQNSSLREFDQQRQYHTLEHSAFLLFPRILSNACTSIPIHSDRCRCTICHLYYLGFDDASCAAWSFCAASWSAIVIDVNFLPIRSCISRYFATHLSRHTASPLLSSDSLYFGGTHFFWQAADILKSNIHWLLSSSSQ